MGLLQNLAAIAIRNKVVGALRENCPQELKEELEQLLADKAAVAAIQGLVGANLKNPAAITAAAMQKLDMPQASRELLDKSPALVDYLVRTAVSRLS
ncbi:MAG: hypothetical protein Q4A24_01165 [Akkermansia sp.]|nr:hypothetical protein [Akkermansia sp.]